MSVRRQIIAALSSGRRGGFVSLYDVDHATRLVDAHAAEARAEALVEGAAAIDAKQNEYEAEERRQFGSLDHETVLQGEAVRDMAAMLRQVAAGEKTTPTGATDTPTDTNRRARLLNKISGGGRWKSGDVVAWYQREGLTGLGANTARRDLAALRDSGAITQHDEKGVRFYTLTTKGAAR